MRAVWNPSGALAGELDDAPAIGKIVAPIVVAAAVLSNFVLCFINTNIFETSPSVVIAVEIGLIGTALALTWDCGIRLYELLLTMAGYFIALMALCSEFDPKIVRDCLIPVAFFFLGRYYGSCGMADRLVAILITVILAVDLFEWLAPSMYVHYFDVIRYYIARGTATETANDLAGGFFNSTRYSGQDYCLFWANTEYLAYFWRHLGRQFRFDRLRLDIIARSASGLAFYHKISRARCYCCAG